jgi:hypothetical protein
MNQKVIYVSNHGEGAIERGSEGILSMRFFVLFGEQMGKKVQKK